MASASIIQMTLENSFTVYLFALALLVFGYLSLIRLVHRQAFGPNQVKQTWQNLKHFQVLSNLGSSAFFLSLPATSLLLFWGWGPALVWLIVFHLIIETLAHLRFSVRKSNQGVADYLLRSENNLLASLEQGLIQVFFLLSMAVVTALLATLIDRQSGLLFALLFLFPARALLRHPSSAMPLVLRVFASLALLALGIAFSDQLGFSIYGDWAPAGSWLPWLNFRNPTVIALVLIVAVFQMEKNSGFKRDLSSFAGCIILLLVIAMQIFLTINQHQLDAPITAEQTSENTLPIFIGICLFIFTGFASLIIRLLNEESSITAAVSEPGTASGAAQFARLQSSGLAYFLFMLCLILSIAAALGIGAWKSHYIGWDDSLNILEHLNLAISSTLVLLGSEAESGSVLHTILLTALCIAGFSFMMNCANQLTLEERQKETIYGLVLESKLPQAILIFLGSCYLIEAGININFWILIGVLGWTLLCHLALGMCIVQKGNHLSIRAWKALTLVIILVGAIQLGFLIFEWFSNNDIIIASFALLIAISCVLLWHRDIPAIIKSSSSSEDHALF